MIIFGACMALAIYFRKRPEYHRRLVFMASCQLMQATFVRFHTIGYHDLSLPALDVLIVAGNYKLIFTMASTNRLRGSGRMARSETSMKRSRQVALRFQQEVLNVAE